MGKLELQEKQTFDYTMKYRNETIKYTDNIIKHPKAARCRKSIFR